MTKKAMSLLGISLFVMVSAAQADQTVLCYSCKGPAESSRCSFNGKEGTWGTPVTVNGVTYQVCKIPSITVIRVEDAILDASQLQLHSMRIARGLNPRDLRFQTPPTAEQYRQVNPQQLQPSTPPKDH